MELKGLRREIAGLAKIMNAHDIEEIEVAANGVSLKLKRTGARARAQQGQEVAQREASVQERDALAGATPQTRAESTAPENHITIPAPMVGTFYRAPAPDAKPYVEIGDVVSPGQVLCIIEAMKIMNEIQAEVRGRVVEILVENAEPVEYGQPLFVLEAL
ncbi:MAG: acetyl-CoA carboxylase biotin carboxyl carrier protein [Clostridia bacterium]